MDRCSFRNGNRAGSRNAIGGRSYIYGRDNQTLRGCMSTGAAQRTTSTRYDATTSTVAPSAPARERLLSLDVFRGITVAGMLLVNNPGTWSAIFPPLEHAEWNGWTPTDLIFPFFLFIVGITSHLSLTARRARGDDDSALVKQILRRGIIIYLLGFAMAMFPFYQWGAIQ